MKRGYTMLFYLFKSVKNGYVFLLCVMIAQACLLFGQSDLPDLDSTSVLKADPNYLAKNYFLVQCGLSSAPSLSEMMEDALPGWDISGAGGLLLAGVGYGVSLNDHIHFVPKMKTAFTKIKKVYEDFGITKETGFIIFSLGSGIRYTMRKYAPAFYIEAEVRKDYPSGLEDIKMKASSLGSGIGFGYIFPRRSIEIEIGYSIMKVKATSESFIDKIYDFGGLYVAFSI